MIVPGGDAHVGLAGFAVALELAEAGPELLSGELRQQEHGPSVAKDQDLAGLDDGRVVHVARPLREGEMRAALLDDVRRARVEVGGVSAGDGEERFVGQVAQLGPVATPRAALAQHLDRLGQAVLIALVALDEIPAVCLAQQLQSLELGHELAPGRGSRLGRDHVFRHDPPAAQQLLRPTAGDVVVGQWLLGRPETLGGRPASQPRIQLAPLHPVKDALLRILARQNALWTIHQVVASRKAGLETGVADGLVGVAGQFATPHQVPDGACGGALVHAGRGDHVVEEGWAVVAKVRAYGDDLVGNVDIGRLHTVETGDAAAGEPGEVAADAESDKPSAQAAEAHAPPADLARGHQSVEHLGAVVLDTRRQDFRLDGPLKHLEALQLTDHLTQTVHTGQPRRGMAVLPPGHEVHHLVRLARGELALEVAHRQPMDLFEVRLVDPLRRWLRVRVDAFGRLARLHKPVQYRFDCADGPAGTVHDFVCRYRAAAPEVTLDDGGPGLLARHFLAQAGRNRLRRRLRAEASDLAPHDSRHQYRGAPLSQSRREGVRVLRPEIYRDQADGILLGTFKPDSNDTAVPDERAQQRGGLPFHDLVNRGHRRGQVS